MAHYGIVGIGEAKTSVVHEGLADILESDPGATFLIHARRNPQGSVGDVYDFLVDNEVPYIAYTKIDDNAPKALLNSAVEVVKDEDPLALIIESSDTILMLWDEKDDEASNRLAIRASGNGRSIKDLSMALTPIVVEDSPEEKPAPAQEEKDTLVAFTRDELMEMSIGVLKRQAKSLGIENAGNTKEEIVGAILGDEQEPVVEAPAKKSLGWSSKEGAIKISISETGELQEITLNVKLLIDSGFLKPSTS